MDKHFNYPISLHKAKEGGYIIKFRDLPEAITQTKSTNIEEVLYEATDCLEEAIANRMTMKLAIPNPSIPKKNQHIAILPITLAAKVALYVSLKEAKLTNLAFAKKFQCDEKEVRRLLNPYHISKLPRIESALEKLGLHLTIGITTC